MAQDTPEFFYVFAGRGVDDKTTLESVRRVFKDRPDIEVRSLTARQLSGMARLDPHKIRGFMLPGGAKPQYDESIGLKGFKKIREYVAKGGIFYGICAGAYYASRELEWRPGTGEYKYKTPGLDFFNGLARGPEPALMHSEQASGEWKDACVISFESEIEGQKQIGQALYWDGPVLFSRDYYQDIDVLAHIVLEQARLPAILKIPHGKGHAILSTIHPEISAKQIGPYVDHDPELACRITSKLEDSDTVREMLWMDLLGLAIDNRPANIYTPLTGHKKQLRSGRMDTREYSREDSPPRLAAG